MDYTEVDRLVTSIARRIWHEFARWRGGRHSLDDFIQFGWVGALEALSRLDLRREEREIKAYVGKRVEGAILDALRRDDPLSQARRGKIRLIKGAQDRLHQRLGREPTILEVAQELGMSEAEVHQPLGLAVREVPLDDVDATSERAGLPDIETQAQNRELWEAVEACRGFLNETKPRLFESVFFHVFLELGFEEVAPILGVSRATAERLVKKGLRLLKECLEAKGWSLSDVRLTG
jgi:RNA polymerase sigma factor (sigma-70 family)